MAEVIPFGEPESESERMAIAYLRAHLPSSYKLFTNLEIKQGVEIFEIDLILLAPHCVYVVDCKNWHGRIDIIDPKWYPDNCQSYPSPLKKLRKHAKVLSSTICDANRAMQQLSAVHVQATVLMTADDVNVVDQSGTDGDHVTYLDKRCLLYFQSDAYIPQHRLRNIQRFLPDVERAIRGKSSPKTSPSRYRDWQVEDKLGSNDRYTEYRARNLMVGVSSWTARLRVYKVDPFLESGDRDKEYKLIGNAFAAVRQLPPHPNILSVQDFFANPDRDCLVLVTEDVPGQVLRQHIKKQNLTLEQKLTIMRDVLHGLEHAHKHGVIHRNITPDSILITKITQALTPPTLPLSQVGVGGEDYHARLVGFDYARVTNRQSTIADEILDEWEQYAAYQAPECQEDPSKASITSDLFSAGLVFYEMLFQEGAGGQSSLLPAPRSLLPSLDSWLQKLCAIDPLDRFPSAGAALQQLTPLAALPSLDITNLPPDTIIDDRYRVISRLGNPGSFAVAYKVFDTLGQVEQVLKLVKRNRSVYERLQQEYKTLLQVPKHPHIVEVLWAGHLKDDTPFIVFEYVDGQDVEQLIAAKISREQAIEIAHQTAIGLDHLHKHKVFHQDIKPSNLLVTDKGVRIIDFNIAVFDSDEITSSVGTRRYMPPDYKPSNNLTADEKIDRDIYALGITFYECLTGRYPFDKPQPPLRKLPHNPTEIKGCEDLSKELVKLLMRSLAPKRANRFTSAAEFIEAIACLREQGAGSGEQGRKEDGGMGRWGDGAEGQRGRGAEGQRERNSFFSPAPVLRNSSLLPAPHSLLPAPHFNRIVLDPTELYDIPPGYIPITTEVEWMRSFGVSDSPYWVKGKRLCEWASEWLRVWDKTEAIAEIKQNPRWRLENLFRPVPIPEEWTQKQLLDLATRLDFYPQNNPVAHLLADITGSDRQIWLGEPSIQNLAAWLAIQVPEECKPLEQVWQFQVKEHDLAAYYQTEDKLLLLCRWLSIAEPVITELGKYPLPVPDFLTAFDLYWEQQIYRTEGKIIDTLIPNKQSGMERIGNIIHKVFSKRPDWNNKARETKVSAYLSYEQKLSLSDRQAPPQPEPLALDASPKQALSWVTQSYLPFRRWEVVINQADSEQRISDARADSFVEWMLEHYPEMKVDSVDHSYLNYSVTSLVRNLCQVGAVLWVVVDGLGWLDHLELLSLLTKNYNLAVETAIQPRFSILPTKTEYAKWSLYAQLPPSSPDWVDDVSKGFLAIGMGKRYTDGQVDKLYGALKKKTHKLYCWDTDTFDSLYHSQKDWQSLYQVERPHTLEGIAKKIDYCLQQYPNPDDLSIVIASDHGQIMGMSEQITHCPAGLLPKGRMAIGKTDDPRFVVLERDRYDLPHDISIIRGSASSGSFSYTANKKIIGSHGGLFPEEVVVGVSVLRKSVQRLGVLISCRGKGKPKQPGELEITIDNPNSVPLTDMSLCIQQLPDFNSGQLLEQEIPANERVTFKVTIPCWPELAPTHESDRLSLSGELTFRFASAEAGAVALDRESAIVVNQIFSSGFDIDEFF